MPIAPPAVNHVAKPLVSIIFLEACYQKGLRWILGICWYDCISIDEVVQCTGLPCPIQAVHGSTWACWSAGWIHHTSAHMDVHWHVDASLSLLADCSWHYIWRSAVCHSHHVGMMEWSSLATCLWWWWLGHWVGFRLGRCHALFEAHIVKAI